jgi:hypothetical protein
MKTSIFPLISFIFGLACAIFASALMFFAGNDQLPMSITFLIVGIVLISGSPLMGKRLKS